MSKKLTLTLLLGTTLIFLAGCDSPEEKQAKYIQRGDNYMQEHDYVHARLEYKNAAKIDPTNPRAIYSLGLVEEGEGNINAALSAFMTAEQQDQNFEPVVQKLAEFFLTAQQTEQAQIRIDRLLQINPNSSMAHALNASLLLKKRDFFAAQREVNKALELDKGNIIAYSVLSGLHFAQHEPEKALAVLDEGLKQKPDELSFYLLKAVIYADRDDLENVQDVYKKVFALKPEKIKYRFDLAQILEASDNKTAAEKVLRETIEQFPESEEAKRKLVSLVEEEKGMQSAETEIKTLIKQSPSQHALYLWLAELYLRNKRDDLAISALKNILTTTGDDWVGLTANTSMARIKLSQGDVEIAQKLIEAVLSKDVNNSDALLLRASLTLSQGDYEQALGDIRNVIRDHPDSAQAARMMTEILLTQGRQDLAIDTLLQYHDHAPKDLGAQVRLAQLYALKGDNDVALDILKKITESDQSYVIAWETIARLSIQDKNYKEAERAINQLAKNDSQKANVLFLQGQFAAAKEDKQEALQAYEQVIKQYPQSKLVDHALAGILAISKSQDDLTEVAEILKTTPSDNPAVASVLGGIQAQLGQTEDAIGTLRHAISLKPETQAAYLSLAEIYKGQGNVDEALSTLSQAEKDAPYDIKASMMKAQILVEKEEVDKAISLYETLLEKNKGSQASDVIANNFAQTIADHKSDDKAAMEKARLVAERFINSDNPYYLDTLAWVYYKQGNLAAAQPLLNKARSLLKTPNKDIEKHYKQLTQAISTQQ